MSGGQKQRVASARAITNPKIILADEPTGALDSKSSKALLESFNQLNKDIDATILMVTHDPFSASYASRVYLLKMVKSSMKLEEGMKVEKIFLKK